MKKSYTENFSIDGLNYFLEFMDSGTINFGVIDGKFKDGKYAPLDLDKSDPFYYCWNDDDDSFSAYDVKNRTKNPVKVVREVARRILGYVSRRRPGTVSIGIYNPKVKKIVDRYIDKGIPSGYNYYIDRYAYRFVKS